MGNTTWVTQGKKEITMDTVSCKHCVCKNVCFIRRDIDEAISSSKSGDRMGIIGIRHKIYKILASDCVEYAFKGKE